MTVTTSLANVKARLSSFVDAVQQTHERVVITRNGEPAAVLISPQDLESLEETLDVFSSESLMADIAQGRAEIAEGRTVALPEFPRT